jgi:histone acetyltransferase (RNA polymerase elongator complex component)
LENKQINSLENIRLRDLQFPQALPEQAGEITALVNSVYRGEHAKKGWTTEADILEGIRITEQRVREMINSENNAIIIAVFENKIIGCVHLEKKDDDCWLGMLSVDVDYQTYGLGKILIEKCESYAKYTFRCEVMKMRVIGVRSELIAYYLRRGYSLSGEKEDFMIAEDTFGEPKNQNLFFEILAKKI